MNRRLIILTTAQRDIALALDYIAEIEGLARAKKVKATLDETLERILANPFAFEIDRLFQPNSDNVRRCIVRGRFRLVYRVSSDSVSILRFYPTSMNPTALI